MNADFTSPTRIFAAIGVLARADTSRRKRTLLPGRAAHAL